MLPINPDAFDHACAIAGNASRLARTMGVLRQRLMYYRQQQRMPLDIGQSIEQHTGVQLHELFLSWPKPEAQ